MNPKDAQALVRGRPVAIVGCGLVGSGWALVFARAGLAVRLHDAVPGVAERALAHVRAQADALAAHGLLDDAPAVAARVRAATSLAEALDGACYVQESVLERVEVKRALLEQMQPLLAPDAVVGSSTSGIVASRFAQGLACAPRVLVAHPVNPPHLVPVVELVPSPDTAASALDFADALMRAVGQSPVRVNREVDGFVLNRLQAVLLREAWALVDEGVASCEDVDKTVRDGLGLRWAFMGPFETIDLNAPGGVADYAERLGPLYQGIAAERQHEQPWDAALIERVQAQRRAELPADRLAERRDWRDRLLMAVARFRRDQVRR